LAVPPRKVKIESAPVRRNSEEPGGCAMGALVEMAAKTARLEADALLRNHFLKLHHYQLALFLSHLRFTMLSLGLFYIVVI